MSSIITTNNIVKVILHKKSNLKERRKLLVCTGYPYCSQDIKYCRHYGIHLCGRLTCGSGYCTSGGWVECVEIEDDLDKIDEIIEYENK